jgi:hypothetical protein
MAQKPVPRNYKKMLSNVILMKGVNLNYENLKVEIQKELLRRKNKKSAPVHVTITREGDIIKRHTLLENKDDKICNVGKKRRFSIYSRFVSIEISKQDPRYSEMTK